MRELGSVSEWDLTYLRSQKGFFRKLKKLGVDVSCKSIIYNGTNKVVIAKLKRFGKFKKINSYTGNAARTVETLVLNITPDLFKQIKSTR
jgi:hypothetical protein